MATEPTIALPELLLFAIERRIQLRAIYNRGEAALAPHSLLERHGDLFLRAVTMRFDGRAPREPKLGTFKLAGLSNVRLTGSEVPDGIFAAAEVRGRAA